MSGGGKLLRERDDNSPVVMYAPQQALSQEGLTRLVSLFRLLASVELPSDERVNDHETTQIDESA